MCTWVMCDEKKNRNFPLLFHPFLDSPIHAHLPIHSCMHASIHASIHACIHSFIHPSIHASTHSFIRSYIYLTIHPSSAGPSIKVSIQLYMYNEKLTIPSLIGTHLQSSSLPNNTTITFSVCPSTLNSIFCSPFYYAACILSPY